MGRVYLPQAVQPQYFSPQALNKDQAATTFTVWPWTRDWIISERLFPHLQKGTNNTYFSELWELSDIFSKTLTANNYSNEPYYYQKLSTIYLILIIMDFWEYFLHQLTPGFFIIRGCLGSTSDLLGLPFAPAPLAMASSVAVSQA